MKAISRTLALALIVVSMLGASVTAWSQDNSEDHRRDRMERGERHERMYMHTEDQQAQVGILFKQAKVEMQDLKEEMELLHQQMREGKKNGTLTRAELKELMEKMAALKVEMKMVMFDALEEAKEILTAEQLEKLEEMREHRRGREHRRDRERTHRSERETR